MSPTHRAHRGHQPTTTTGWVVIGVLLIAFVSVVWVVSAVTAAPTPVTSPAPVVSTSLSAPTDTPPARAYLGALYADGGIGPDTLTATNALKLGRQVCDGIHGADHVSLAGSYAYIRDVTRLSRIQAARLVDAADQNLCP